jgi:hypothetical protein
MALHPKERDEYGYATKLWNRRFKSKGIKLKTIQNCVAEYRKDKYREMLNKTALRAKLPKKPSRES